MNEDNTESLDERRALALAVGEWGSSVRMSDELAGDIFAAVIATPSQQWWAPGAEPEPEPEPEPDTPLDAAWWRRYSADLAETMVHSTRWARTA